MSNIHPKNFFVSKEVMDSSNVAGSSSILVIFQPTLFASDVVSLRDEWLGEKYLECKLSERLVRDASEVDKTTSLNVCVPIEIQEMPVQTLCIDPAL